MPKMYIVAEVNWQYNDEYYFVEEGLGPLKKGFYCREEADKVCRELNKNEFARLSSSESRYDSIGDYIGGGYSGGGLLEYSSLSEKEIISKLESVGLTYSDGNWSTEIKSNRCGVEGFEEDQIDMLITVLDLLRFFEVVPVDMD